MSMRSPYLHTKEAWIERAQTHSLCKMLDCLIWFTEPQFDPAAVKPSQLRVRINQQGPVKDGSTAIERFADISERVSCQAEYTSVVLTYLHSPSSQLSSFGNLVLSVDDPARLLALSNTRRDCGVRERVIRIKFNGFVKQAKRFVISLPGPLAKICKSAQKRIVGIEVLGWSAPGTFDLCL